MTTSHMDAATWSQASGTTTSDASPKKEGSSFAVALIGVGAVLNVAWVGLVAFVAVRLMIF